MIDRLNYCIYLFLQLRAKARFFLNINKKIEINEKSKY